MESKTIGQRLKQGTAVIAAALIVGYMGLISVSEVGDYVPWSAGFLGLGIAAALCGILLALIDEQAIRLMSMACVLGVLIFGGFWSIASWALLGEQISFLELVLSDLVFSYVLRRGILLLLISILFGLLGTVGMQIILPSHYRP